MNNLLARVRDDRLSPFERLIELIAVLRSPEGCNWDRAQTHQTLVPYLIEETYEVVDTIQTDRLADLREELGDLLVQVVFHAQLARERGEFQIEDAINDVVDKLVRRHPHVFGEQRDLNPQQVRDQWERIKTESGEKKSVLGGLPKSMPALTMAFRMGEKAGGVGFDWNHPHEVLNKIEEELAEVKQAMASGGDIQKEALTSEIGDLLFATASLARKLSIDPEHALKQSLEKFRSRFGSLEQAVKKSGRTIDALSIEQLEEIWQEVKRGREK
jgi:tetrapyrrole methylase family protein / MazG family protein